MTSDPLTAIDAALADAPDADDALRETVRILAAQPGIVWAGVAFVETTGLVLGPSAGTPDEARITNSAPSIPRLPRWRWYSVRAWSK